MKILIGGASGFIGRYLLNELNGKGYTIVALSRHPEKQTGQKNISWRKWQDGDTSDWQDEMENSDVVINLIGESLAAKRWTESRKKVLVESRVKAGQLFLKAFEKSKNKPRLFIQSSAIGYYAIMPSSDEKSPAGNDFLAQTCIKWEESTKAIEEMDCNRIILRTGLVLANDSLLIKKFKLPFFIFIGGHLGNGQQIMSWIHITDVIRSVLFMIENVTSSQVFNLTAPNPVTMREFCKRLGKTMKRPSWLHVPAFVLKIIFGQMAKETMLKGHKVLPENLLKSGFDFKYREIGPAFDNMPGL